MTEIDSHIEDRPANVRLIVQNIISSKQDEMFEQFDRLHKRGINDDEVVTALRSLGDIDLMDAYAEWADIDIREDDNTTTNPVVPDPGDAPSYAAMGAAPEIREDADLAGKWSNGLAELELTRQHLDTALIGVVWEAVQRDTVFGNRHLAITPGGLAAAGYRRVSA